MDSGFCEDNLALERKNGKLYFRPAKGRTPHPGRKSSPGGRRCGGGLTDFGGEDSGEGDTEEVLELSDFDLSSLDIVNPSLQEFSGSSAIGWLKETLDGSQLKISLTAPVEMVARCFMNQCIKFTKGTDLGDMIRQVAQADMKKLLDGVRTLQQKELLTASDQLVSLIEQIEFILMAEDEGDKDQVDQLIDGFKTQANTCLENAQTAFNAVGTNAIDEQIRSSQIAVSVLIATECCNNLKVTKLALRKRIEQEVLKLLKLERIQNDAKHQLDPNPSSRALDYKQAREARIRAVLMVILHAESFASTNDLEAILPKKRAGLSFSSKNTDVYPVTALLKSGVFEGKTTAKQLKELGEQFSDKELSVMAGFLKEEADDLGLVTLKMVAEEKARKETELLEAQEREQREKDEAKEKAGVQAEAEQEAVREAERSRKEAEEEEKREKKIGGKRSNRQRKKAFKSWNSSGRKFGNEDLKALAKEYCADAQTVEKKYGPISWELKGKKTYSMFGNWGGDTAYGEGTKKL
ncbi:hypothetical protein TrVE_jg6415 [Triparma verrucosa]|uniref:Uncharacterized protein n=1 Tax=Triparma verrucosa TaxID=1606542 RepID=A0A9W7CLQ2_9STRA|nr:hypothetical protein TrVE_jg6415 [Triparma verrucosa]